MVGRLVSFPKNKSDNNMVARVSGLPDQVGSDYLRGRVEERTDSCEVVAMDLLELPLVEEHSETSGEALYANKAKRALDVVGAFMALLLFAPLMALIFLIVKLDGGPAFFGHTRIGKDGRAFTCWKFRSMVVDSEEVLEEVLHRDPAARAEWNRDFKLTNDPRITAIGAFLRKSSLDELPQILNVLKGDMSLVGPRPIVAAEVPRYRQYIQDYFRCRPGITGLWQVSGRNDIDYETRVQLDSEYVRGWTLASDIKIMFKTLEVVFRGDGAY